MQVVILLLDFSLFLLVKELWFERIYVLHPVLQVLVQTLLKQVSFKINFLDSTYILPIVMRISLFSSENGVIIMFMRTSLWLAHAEARCHWCAALSICTIERTLLRAPHHYVITPRIPAVWCHSENFICSRDLFIPRAMMIHSDNNNFLFLFFLLLARPDEADTCYLHNQLITFDHLPHVV